MLQIPLFYFGIKDKEDNVVLLSDVIVFGYCPYIIINNSENCILKDLKNYSVLERFVAAIFNSVVCQLKNFSGRSWQK